MQLVDKKYDICNKKMFLNFKFRIYDCSYVVDSETLGKLQVIKTVKIQDFV
jgi:hypothetical protein